MGVCSLRNFIIIYIHHITYITCFEAYTSVCWAVMRLCSLRHITRTSSRMRRYGRYVHNLVFLVVAVVVVLNVLYVLPLTNLQLARSAGTWQDVTSDMPLLSVPWTFVRCLSWYLTFRFTWGRSVRLVFHFRHADVFITASVLRPMFPMSLLLVSFHLAFRRCLVLFKGDVCYSYFGYCLLKAAVGICIGIVYALVVV